MNNVELTEEINAITTDWELRGPYHEDGGKHHALLRGEWLGDGYDTKLQALRAIYEQVRAEKSDDELRAEAAKNFMAMRQQWEAGKAR